MADGSRQGSARSVAVLGAGSWGTTFAKILADAARAAGNSGASGFGAGAAKWWSRSRARTETSST
ncbi:glycerol-3-Phosphate dehydrogenase [Arthrobacter sp. Hiyo4]|nr:glycerol-3-Phosphate dehydrogenase [Arthrobacter sp. Hiyo4]